MKLRIEFVRGSVLIGEFITTGTFGRLEHIAEAVALGSLPWITIESNSGKHYLCNLSHAQTIDHIKEDDDEA